MFCPECGKEIPAGSNFCLFCGSSLDRVRRFLEETQITKEKGNSHMIGEMTDAKRAQASAWVVKGDNYVSSGDDEDALRSIRPLLVLTLPATKHGIGKLSSLCGWDAPWRPGSVTKILYT